MRIARLDLTRYGLFTDASIDLGRPFDGRPDFHIVYGGNETGKSTLFAGLLDLLFGWERSSRYAFLHPLASLRIGAHLDLGDRRVEIVRQRKPTALTDPQGVPLAESLVLGDLAGFDKATYAASFCLDDETLVRGGEGIMASAGDLGMLLFSASSGLADFGTALTKLKVEADGFYKTRGQNHTIAEGKRRLAALKDSKEAIDTFAPAYGRLAAEREKSRVLYEETIAERGRVHAALGDVRWRLAALPLVVQVDRIAAELTAMSAHPTEPDGWAEALPALITESTELDTRRRDLDEEMLRLEGALASMPVDEAALAALPRVGRFKEARARHTSATSELANLRLEYGVTVTDVSRIQASLGFDASEDAPTVKASVRGRLRALMEERSGIASQLAAARGEIASTRRRVASLEDEGGTPKVTEALEDACATMADALTRLDAGHDARRRVAERDLAKAETALTLSLAALAPWTGQGSALAAMHVPATKDVEMLERRLIAAKAAAATRLAVISQLETERRMIEAEIAAIMASGQAVDDASAMSARQARQNAWEAHRAALDHDTADEFERAMQADDAIAATRLAGASDVAALRHSRRLLAIKNAELLEAEYRKRETEQEARCLEAERNTSVEATVPALASGQKSIEFSAWLGLRERALEAWYAVQTAEGALDGVNAEAEAAQRSLATALSRCGFFVEGATTLDLIAAARAALAQRDRSVAVRSRLAETRTDLERRELQLEATRHADEAWDAKWHEALAQSWLGSAGTSDVGAVREVLTSLEELGPAVQRRDTAAARIAAAETAIASFIEDVDTLAVSLGMGACHGDPIEVADRIDARLTLASDMRAERAARLRDLADATRRGEVLERAVARHESVTTPMITYYGADTLASVANAIAASRRGQDLKRRLAEIEAQILENAKADSLATAMEKLRDGDRDELERQAAELSARLDDLDGRLREVFAATSRAADALDAVGGDSTAMRIETERRTLLLEIREGALRHLALRAGIAAAEEAIRLYRERHCSSMMKAASDAFAEISGGAYRALAAHATDKRETLIALPSNGGSRFASELSKGARFQLYLALRIAGYTEFVKARAPVPFVADDVLESFDDDRAERSLRLLAGMARSGQVIYLTHHRHLCDLARRACPGIVVHELDRRA